MNNLEVAGILRTYSEKAAKAYSTKKLREIIADLKKELDMRKVRIDNA